MELLYIIDQKANKAVYHSTHHSVESTLATISTFGNAVNCHILTVPDPEVRPVESKEMDKSVDEDFKEEKVEVQPEQCDSKEECESCQ